MLKDKLNISTIDIDLYRDHIYNKDKIKSLDVNSRFKRFKFFYNGLLLNLENINVRAYMIKSDGKEIFNDLTIIDGNIAELEFTNQSLLVPGILKLELVLYEDDAELSSFLLEYEVIKSLRSDNSIESSNEYNSLQIALQKVELWNKNYQALYDKWNNDFNILYANKSAILDNLKTTKENELNKLKSDKDSELTTLYNSKDEELNTLKTTWDEEFKKKYDGLNKEYSARVSNLENDVLNAEYSEDLINENVTSFKVGTGEDELGLYLDYTNEMEQSLVNLDNIEGKTVIKSNHLNEAIFTNRKLKCMYTLDELDNKNYFDDAVNLPVDGCSSSHTGNNIIVNTSSSEWMYTTYKVSNLEIGKVYCLNCDNVTILNGSSAIDIDIESRDYIISNRYLRHSGLPNHNANGLVFIANKSSIEFYFYCNMANDNIGNVIYNNVSLRVVKDYTQLDLDFRSVPDGTCDKLINSKYIQTINEVNITGNENILEASDSGEFKQFFIRINDIKHGEVLSDEFDFCANVPLGWVKKSSTEGENYQGQCIRVVGGNLYFKVSQTTLVNWKNWLKNIGGIRFTYKKNTSLINDINSSILCIPGSTIYIDTPISLDCVHKVQLNTKSQVEELQKSFISEKNSIWSKIKYLIDIKMDLSKNGYFKLPTVFGGFLIQWGIHDLKFVNQMKKHELVQLNLAYTHFFNIVSCTGRVYTGDNPTNAGTYPGESCLYNTATSVDPTSLSTFGCEALFIPRDGNLSDWICSVNWLSIGK